MPQPPQSSAAVPPCAFGEALAASAGRQQVATGSCRRQPCQLVSASLKQQLHLVLRLRSSACCAHCSSHPAHSSFHLDCPLQAHGGGRPHPAAVRRQAAARLGSGRDERGGGSVRHAGRPGPLPRRRSAGATCVVLGGALACAPPSCQAGWNAVTRRASASLLCRPSSPVPTRPLPQPAAWMRGSQQRTAALAPLQQQ